MRVDVSHKLSLTIPNWRPHSLSKAFIRLSEIELPKAGLAWAPAAQLKPRAKVSGLWTPQWQTNRTTAAPPLRDAEDMQWEHSRESSWTYRVFFFFLPDRQEPYDVGQNYETRMRQMLIKDAPRFVHRKLWTKKKKKKRKNRWSSKTLHIIIMTMVYSTDGCWDAI